MLPTSINRAAHPDSRSSVRGPLSTKRIGKTRPVTVKVSEVFGILATLYDENARHLRDDIGGMPGDK